MQSLQLLRSQQSKDSGIRVNSFGREAETSYGCSSCSFYSLVFELHNRHITEWNQLTSWSRALFEKRPIMQLLKNFPVFYATRRFMTVLSRALHWSLSRATSIQISLRSILILSTYLRLGLPCGLLPPGFPTNILHAILFSNGIN
jgi:hypothetical protein